MKLNIALGLLTTVSASYEADKIQHLPGFGDLGDSPWYSGYLTYQLPGETQTINTHYLFAKQTLSQPDADTSKLLFWSNGGPGASSLMGWFTELGPIQVNDDSLQTDEYKKTGIPTLFPNPTSWSNFADLLVFDAPAPVGFSYCEAVDGDGYSCGDWDDERASANNLAAMKAFYEKFPELKSKSLYLSGESYAGVYIPTMARAIVEDNDANSDASTKINLKGLAVGDACTGTEVLCGDATGLGPWWDMTFMYGHHQFSTKLYDEMITKCTEKALKHSTEFPLSDGCNDVLDRIHQAIGGYYSYALYDDCTYSNGLMSAANKNGHVNWRYERDERHKAQILEAGGALNDYTCGGTTAMEEYVAHPDVKKAWHLDENAAFFMSDNGVGFNYNLTEKSLLGFYEDLAVGKWAGEEIKVLVYNGDTDPGINSFVAQNWTSSLGLEEVEEQRPWTIDDCQRMGGYVTKYEGGFEFLTIRGAGHMVPTYKPEASFEFFGNWMNGVDYKRFNGDCVEPEL
ncbi:hypothetical protein ScalyP_jg3042 [Parmales sp. scaly parma]|nr:hypothetical protein ScalyP_jg3042 [Parmales sp. scaly parma]